VALLQPPEYRIAKGAGHTSAIWRRVRWNSKSRSRNFAKIPTASIANFGIRP
jgi:hypothetical protein